MQSAVLLLLFSASLASANLNCYYDKSTYSSYLSSYNEKAVQCSYLTSYCFMQTTSTGNNTYRRLADCDYNYGTICATLFSGCKVQGQTETCCCRTNYCNYPSDSGSGYSAVLPMIITVLSYALLK